MPFENTFQGKVYYAYVRLGREDVLNLFNIPADATVESFSINGFSLEVVPDILSPADIMYYDISYSYTDDPNYYIDLLVEDNVPVSYGTSIGLSNNLTKKLKGKALSALTCVISNMLNAQKQEGCLTFPNTIGKFRISYEAKLKDGTPAEFAGTVKGYLKAQVSYTVCESLPEGIFASGLEKCQ